jgi:hypothetical protein
MDEMRMTERSRAFSAAQTTLSRAWLTVSRLSRPEPEVEPFVAGETRIGRLAIGPALWGGIGALLVLWGASQTTSPFTLNRSTFQTLSDPTAQFGATWYFGTGPLQGRGGELAFVVVVYAGMFFMIRAWLGLVHLTRAHPGTPVRKFVPIFVAWMLPLLVVAPLFSHDAYAYVAQGEEMTRHINPYLYSTSILGVGGSPYPSYVDALWSHTTSPYGPVFLALAGFIVVAVHHSELAALVGFRVVAVFGVVLMAIYAPRLARSYGRDPSKAFVLVALNPLVLFHLVAGEHNDALMMGLVVAGLALARERHPAIGIVLCALGGLVKAPALLGVVYIGWDWAGVEVALRQRLRTSAMALGIAGAVMVAITYVVGLGWDWVLALYNPTTVNSWMDPATGIGGAVARIVNGVGLGEHVLTIVAVARGVGLLLAAVIALRLLTRSNAGASSLWGLGLSLLAIVVLGPVVQPWYLVWGVVLLAPIAEGRTRVLIMWLSAVMSFLGLPGGRALLQHIEQTNPLLVTAAAAALVAIVAATYAPRFRQLAVERRDRARVRVLAGEATTAARGGS